MFFAILFLISVLAIISLIFINNKKILLLKQQLLLSNNQINKLKNKLSEISIKDIKLTFVTPDNIKGILKENTNVLLCPIKNSFVLHKTNIKMEVYIIDMVMYKNSTWYYVSLPLDKNINSRGWVNKSDFSIFYDNTKDISKNF